VSKGLVRPQAALALRLASAPAALALRLASALAALCAAGALALPAPALASPPPALSARAAVLIDAAGAQPLYALGANRELAIASTTKLMTALVTLEHVRKLQTSFVQNQYSPAPVDSQIGLVAGERMTVRDLLLAMLLPSADDAAEDLAYNVGNGSVARFVAMMNARAAQLGLTHTHYSTPIGLDTAGNYSTASDLVGLARFLLAREPFFAHAVALPSAVLPSGPVRRVTNLNDLVGRVPWINGVKTGHTLDAGYVLIGSGTSNGMTLISAVLGAPSASARDADTLALLRYGFENFRVFTPVRAGTVLARPSVRYKSGVRAPVIAASTFTRVFARSARVRTRVEVPRQLTGPLPRHAIVGTVLVLAGNRTIARIPLELVHALPAVNPVTPAAVLTRPSTLVLIVLVLGAAVGSARFRRLRTRGRAAATSR
jgi:serine-type D-Ala-D-Ala carboxypeptidase (penicillin-binding protein 5/6)